MQPFEFLGYDATPGEKHLGIATIRAWGKIILKYKIVSGKDGQGWFKNAGSMKSGVGADGKDHYEKSFMIDSKYEDEQVDKLIRQHINPYAQQTAPNAQNQANQGQNVFGYQPMQQTQYKPIPVQNPATGQFAQPGNANFSTPANPPGSVLYNPNEEVPF